MAGLLEGEDAAGASDYAIHVSPAALAAFNAEFADLVERYRHGPAGPDGSNGAGAPGAPEAETVQVHLHAFPLPKADR